ncbi:MAG: Coenzyme F420 hydrogenase/dehydrogenase, beta subunit C-terminal domain, partial [Bacteroidaceae bacterium]|nr:Coenzyme F420 hydrogenase/dehydrogenase, beta subunit C-terminal domain [Bacteroidaceae bacterium]
YPVVDVHDCKECGMCMRACPSLSRGEGKRPLKALAAIHPNEDIRLQSSSGGIFSLLAERTIEGGGHVFGATFDRKWNVVHSQTNRKECLRGFRGSKYVQSDMRHCYREAEELLKTGIPVMFVGTPCQIAGLHGFLGKPYDKLLTVDFICHGVPSPAVWEWYLRNQALLCSRRHWAWFWRSPLSLIRRVEFRNKAGGWKQFRFVLGFAGQEKSDVHYENPYMRAFLKDVDLRPSCHRCFAKGGRSGSDITLADFWNVHKVIDGFDDDKGTSLVLLNSPKGARIYGELECRSQEVDFDEAIQYNRAWDTPYPENPNRSLFFREYRNYPADFHLMAETKT